MTPQRIKSPITRQAIGRRGAALLVFGVLHLVFGWSVLAAPRSTMYLTVFSAVPQLWYALLWMVPGAVSVVAAFFRGIVEAFGYAVAHLPLTLWGIAYMAEWWPLHELRGIVALRGALLFWSLAVIIHILAGWREPDGEA